MQFKSHRKATITMLWGKKVDTLEDDTRHSYATSNSNSIQQPPPTPGLASWAFNSLFNKQTPSSKYAELAKAKSKKDQQQNSKDVYLEKDDTFFNKNKKKNKGLPSHFTDDTVLSSMNSNSNLNTKNVAWGGQDYRVRTRSSSFSSANPTAKPSLTDFNNYYKEKELLPDADEKDFDFSSTKNFSKVDREPTSNHKRSNSVSTNGYRRFASLKPEPQSYQYQRQHQESQQQLQDRISSLPTTYPGKFPSPHVQKEPPSSSFDSDLLSSSAAKNLKAADYNTQKNRTMNLDSSPVSFPKEQKRSSSRRYERAMALDNEKSDNKKSLNKQRLFKNDTYSLNNIDEDANHVLDSIDKSILEINNITKHIERLKFDGATASYKQYEQLQTRYNELKMELINEFKKSKKMYDSYYKFMDKYKTLKQEYSTLLKIIEKRGINGNKTGDSTGVSESDVLKLHKKIQILKEENHLLSKKIENDDTELGSLKSTLQNSSKFETTLRRKIKYLEDKIEDNSNDFKKERFQLNEKIFLLESKLKDEEELSNLQLRKANERIKELEKKLETKADTKNYYYKSKSSSMKDLSNTSIIPEYSIDTSTSTPKNNSNGISHNRSHSHSHSYTHKDDPNLHPFKEKEENTLEFLNGKYPDRELLSSDRDNIKHSPERIVSSTSLSTPLSGGRSGGGDESSKRSSRRRPMSLQIPPNYKLSDLKDDLTFSKFEKLDESTKNFESVNKRRSISPGMISGMSPGMSKPLYQRYGSSRGGIHGSFPDVSLNNTDF